MRNSSDTISFKGDKQTQSGKALSKRAKLALLILAQALSTTSLGCTREPKISEYEEAIICSVSHLAGLDNDVPDKHIVQSGETLWRIAQDLYNNCLTQEEAQVIVDVIARNNKIKDINAIEVGQELDLTCLKNHKCSFDVSVDNKYRIKEGDTLWSIVDEYYKGELSAQEMVDAVNLLIEHNNVDPVSLSVGQEIDLSCLNKKNERNIVFRNTTPDNLYYPSEELRKRAQNLYDLSQQTAIQTERPRTAPSLSVDGIVIANEQFYESKKEGDLSGYTIMVNAGHGGYDTGGNTFDPGAINEEMGLEEWTIALDYAERLTQKLLDEGANVLLTQGQVNTLGASIENFAANYGEGENDNLKFVSLHCNASESTSVNGTMFYYSSKNDSDSNCADLANSITNVAQEKNINLRANVDANLYVCRNANSFGIENTLVELGFITNAEDANMMVNDENFKENMLDSIVEGIKANVV